MDIEKRKANRLLVLQKAYEVGNSSLDEPIRLADLDKMIPGMEKQEINKAIAYLRQRKYFAIEPDPIYYNRQAIYSMNFLTAYGIDQAESLLSGVSNDDFSEDIIKVVLAGTFETSIHNSPGATVVTGAVNTSISNSIHSPDILEAVSSLVRLLKKNLDSQKLEGLAPAINTLENEIKSEHPDGSRIRNMIQILWNFSQPIMDKIIPEILRKWMDL